jgi:allantoate deiminase
MKNLMEQRLIEDYNFRLDHSGVKGSRIGERFLSIARIGVTAEGGSCRIGYSEEERQAKELIKKWMSEAGLEVKEDAAGNVTGRLTGKEDELPAIMSGSHIDSVPNGGHFDGVLGVLTILEVIEAWKETDYQPIRPFEVVVFSDEEGSQFNAGLTGSKAMMGEIDLAELSSLRDHEGVSFEEVIRKDGLLMDGFVEAAREHKELAAFVEIHIEQGKQLEKYNEPVGIVTGIAGQVGLEFSFKGMAGHAGNTPMAGRQDALVAASDFILSIRSLPEKASASAVATVGRLHVFPNGSNVIPGEVRLSVDIRDIYPDTLGNLVSSVINEAERIAGNHNIQTDWVETLKTDPVPIQKQMQELQAESLLKNQIQPVYIPSGAGHDAMVLGEHLPIAMFFVRSKDGISHHPDEWSSLNDCVMGVHVLKDFLEKLQHSI